MFRSPRKRRTKRELWFLLAMAAAATLGSNDAFRAFALSLFQQAL